jgi:hypothetical protein
MRVESNSTHIFSAPSPQAPYRYLQIVRSVREGKRVPPTSRRHPWPIRSIGSIGQLERLMRSCLRHCQSFAVIDARAAGEIQPVAIRRIGADLIFARLWKESGSRKFCARY